MVPFGCQPFFTCRVCMWANINRFHSLSAHANVISKNQYLHIGLCKNPKTYPAQASFKCFVFLRVRVEIWYTCARRCGLGFKKTQGPASPCREKKRKKRKLKF